jgi:molecular chaperone GrpE
MDNSINKHMNQKKKDTVNRNVRVKGPDKEVSKERPENVVDNKVDILTGDHPKAESKKKVAKGDGTVPVEGSDIGQEVQVQDKDEASEWEGKPIVEKELDKLQQKHEELNDSYLRLHAEYDNFRKRTLKEKAELIKNGGERVLIGIVSLVDDFERALESLQRAEDKEAVLEGIELIHNKFINFLKQHGVNEIEAVGQPFDADRFEAVTTTPVEDEEQKGKVVDCIQKGYALNDKIIRYPKVIVGE